MPQLLTLRPRQQVFLVEDDDAVRSALQFLLRLEGYEVAVFGTGEALLQQDLPGADACLVIDQMLPGIDGLETIQRLHARGVNLPALIITTLPAPALRLAAQAHGVGIVEKPLIGDALTTQIQAALAVHDL